MPMDRCRIRKMIRETHLDLRAARDFDQRSRILSVVAVHRIGAPIDRPADELRIEIDHVAVV